MTLTEALLDSWDRQCRILQAVASKIDDSNRDAKPSEDGWPLDLQLAHIQGVRQEWLTMVSPDRGKALPTSFAVPWKEPIQDLDALRANLDQSAKAIREAMAELLVNGTGAIGGYDHPVLFLQHMVWHEGWHVGLIFLALRLAGQEPTPEWEEANVWGEWRTEEWS